MKVLLAVIDDLWEFVYTQFFGSLFVAQSQSIEKVFFDGPQTPQLQLLTLGESTVSDMYTTSTSRTEQREAVFIQGARYFIGATDVFLYTDPVVAFDTAIVELPYGSLVHVVKLGGRWAHIQYEGREGWILKDALREQSSDVFPEFREGIVYDQEHQETKKIRLCIEDFFGGGRSQVLLSDAEYVTYSLGKKGKKILWREDRPRISGTWQKKLRGTQSVHIGIVPRVDTVMEYIVDDVGHLAYVEAVFSDESIKMSSVGMFDEGVYNNTMMQKAEWIELRPVFIEVTL